MHPVPAFRLEVQDPQPGSVCVIEQWALLLFLQQYN